MLSPAVTRRLLEHFAEGGADARRAASDGLLERLTDREREVAVAVAQGKSNAEIAAELYMSVATVKAHVSRLLDEARAQQPRADRAARARRRPGLTGRMYLSAGSGLWWGDEHAHRDRDRAAPRAGRP